VNFLDAARQGKWIRRRGTTKVLCISERATNFYSIHRSDLLAEDWEIVGVAEPEVLDDSQRRFALLELDTIGGRDGKGTVSR
jgi:hypothetical protein